MVASVRSGTPEGPRVTYHLVIVTNALDDSLGHPTEHLVSAHGGVCFLDVGTNIRNCSTCVPQ